MKTKPRSLVFGCAFGCGLIGWWIMLSHTGYCPRLEQWWLELIFMIVALVMLLWCQNSFGKEMNRLIDFLAERGGHLPAHVMNDKKERIAKWVAVPVIVWWLPVIAALFSGLTSRYE